MIKKTPNLRSALLKFNVWRDGYDTLIYFLFGNFLLEPWKERVILCIRIWEALKEGCNCVFEIDSVVDEFHVIYSIFNLKEIKEIV